MAKDKAQRTRLATALRMYLAATSANQQQLAREIETSQSSLSRFLKGESMLEPATLVKLSAWLLEVA